MWWASKSWQDMVAKFVAGRQPVSDELYLSECGLPDEPLARRVALAVRASVASENSVEPQLIRAADRYPDDLHTLPGWDSLDFIGWVIAFERELGLKISSKAFAGVRVPFSVRELVWAAHEHLVQRADA